ncbi:unnamed protein product [Clonostachys solani]|uniref:EKC/KEOPS complex subunit GON7 n=1 Tax=Clonostachys solani TaxID=160281 RepID=A0A9P0EI58_9HYPO|nr:unnamed protein product [Clonostachys solani]
MAQEKKSDFTVSYSSPSNEPFTITNSIPAPSTSSVQDKATYLSALREAVVSAQDQINKELTDRMEQDKSRATDGNPAAAKGVDEALEEENYGEEVQGED